MYWKGHRGPKNEQKILLKGNLCKYSEKNLLKKKAWGSSLQTVSSYQSLRGYKVFWTRLGERGKFLMHCSNCNEPGESELVQKLLKSRQSYSPLLSLFWIFINRKIRGASGSPCSPPSPSVWIIFKISWIYIFAHLCFGLRAIKFLKMVFRILLKFPQIAFLSPKSYFWYFCNKFATSYIFILFPSVVLL